LLTYRWKYSYKVIEKAAVLNPGRFFTIRYEGLVQQPVYQFGKLCHFLGIPDDPSIFNFHERKKEIETAFPPEIIKRYFSSLMQPVDDRKVGVFKTKLTSKQIRVADLVAGKIAESAGYRRVSDKFNMFEYLWVAPAILYTKGLYAIGKMVRILPYKWMLRLVNKPSVIVSIYTRFFGAKTKI
jgi:hypothetical protein